MEILCNWSRLQKAGRFNRFVGKNGAKVVVDVRLRPPDCVRIGKLRRADFTDSVRFQDIDILHRIMLDIPGDEFHSHLFGGGCDHCISNA
jgi:hypothetical protein